MLVSAYCIVKVEQRRNGCCKKRDIWLRRKLADCEELCVWSGGEEIGYRVGLTTELAGSVN